MTDGQLKQAAQIDIVYFRMAYEACPTCGIKFSEQHPEFNLVPHFNRTCGPVWSDKNGGKTDDGRHIWTCIRTRPEVPH